RATPTPWVAANSVPSARPVTALTEQPTSARCLIVHAAPVRSSSTTPSTVPIAISSERRALRCWLVPPFDSRIIGPSQRQSVSTYGLRRAASSRSIAAFALLLAGSLLAFAPIFLVLGLLVAAIGLLDRQRRAATGRLDRNRDFLDLERPADPRLDVDVD